jgi:hypothetical protein
MASAPAQDPSLAADDASWPLEWAAFRERYFPGRPRHDLEAITAYAAYRTDWAPTLNAAPAKRTT